MPGICGWAGSSSQSRLEGLVQEMIERMAHHPWYQRQTFLEPVRGIALGRVSLGGGGDAAGPALAAGSRSAAFLDGEIYGIGPAQAQASLLDACAAGAAPDRWLASLHGLFASVVWDAPGDRLLLVNDRFGMKPLYYAHGEGRFAFASEIKALLLDPTVSRTPDLQGMASFFRFGQLLGERTFFASVRALPPGVVLEYRPVEDRLTERRYVELRTREPEAGVPDREYLVRLGEAFKAAVDRRLAGEARMGLSLSGGLDSRTILAVVNEERFPVTTVCLGLPGSIDQRMARRMSRITASRYCSFAIDGRFFDRYEEHLSRSVWLTDGHHRTPALAQPALEKYRELGIEVLLRGHGGELLHMRKAYGLSLDAELLAVRGEAELETCLRRRLGAGMLDGVDGPLLKGMSREELDTAPFAALRSLLDELREVEPLVIHRVWRLLLRQWLRRITAMSMLEYGSLLRVRLPYLDNDLVEEVLACPPALKLDDTVQAHILARHRPAFLSIANANTGTRIGAGPLRRKLAAVQRRVFAKLGVPGYQPYERLGLWLRRELRPVAERILLADRCLDRGIFEPDTVRRILSAHAENRRNHTFVILAMMCFEVGQRMILDGERRRFSEAA